MIKRKIIALSLIAALLLPNTAFAQGTLLPEGDATADCATLVADEVKLRSNITNATSAEERQKYLACALKTGKLRVWMLPYFVSYIANFFIALSGTISLLFVILGGFWYMTGGLTDDKEKGKKTIFYALIGMVITLLAWIIVNVIQVQVTG